MGSSPVTVTLYFIFLYFIFYISYYTSYLNFIFSKFLGANVRVELGLSNYATKADFKDITGVDTSNLLWKNWFIKFKFRSKLKNVPTNWGNFRSKVDKLDVHNLEPVSVDLSKLSEAIKMMLWKKMYIMLRSKRLKIKCLYHYHSY